MCEDFYGNYLGQNSIGRNRVLYKGGMPAIAPTPPPVRESNRQVAKEGENERLAATKRDGLSSTLKPASSLLGTYDQPGKRSLL
jgi:hypothetical protein